MEVQEEEEVALCFANCVVFCTGGVWLGSGPFWGLGGLGVLRVLGGRNGDTYCHVVYDLWSLVARMVLVCMYIHNFGGDILEGESFWGIGMAGLVGADGSMYLSAVDGDGDGKRETGDGRREMGRGSGS